MENFKTKFEVAAQYVQKLTKELNALQIENARMKAEKRALKSNVNSGTIEERFAGQNRNAKGQFWFGKAKMTAKECVRVTHELNTYYDSFKHSKIVVKSIRNHKYTFVNNGFDDYVFIGKKKLK